MNLFLLLEHPLEFWAGGPIGVCGAGELVKIIGPRAAKSSCAWRIEVLSELSMRKPDSVNLLFEPLGSWAIGVSWTEALPGLSIRKPDSVNLFVEEPSGTFAGEPIVVC